VAADSGLDQANRLGIRPDLVVGDMDSVTPDALVAAEASGIAIARHPRNKDATDLELAVDAVAEHGLSAAIIIGGTGGRLAHTLANALLLTRRHDIELEWVTSRARITALGVGASASYALEEGPLVSIIPVGEKAICTSTGLRWPLGGKALTTGSTRGVSNEIVDSPATISVIGGDVLIVHERNHDA
jgi:thiamine pyrophosphokinase